MKQFTFTLCLCLFSALAFGLIAMRGPVYAQTPVQNKYGSFQPGTITNSYNRPATPDTAINVTLPGRAYIFSLSATCVTNTPGSHIRITDGNGTVIWAKGGAKVISAITRDVWPSGFTDSGGTNLTVTLDACGSGVFGILDIQAATGF